MPLPLKQKLERNNRIKSIWLRRNKNIDVKYRGAAGAPSICNNATASEIKRDWNLFGEMISLL